VFNTGFRPSYQETWNLTIEREVMRNLAVHASYIGNQGRHLSYGLDVNYARYLAGATVANTQQRRPYQDYGSVLNAFSDSNSSYHGLQLSVERRVNQKFSFEINYTWSKAIDQASTGFTDPTPGQGSSIIPTGLQFNRALADFDVPHRFVTSYVWLLPKLTQSAAWIRNVIGGWESSGLLTVQSGQPFSVSSGTDRSFSGLGIDYADLVGNPYLDSSRPRKDLISQYFNTAAFAPNALGTFGTAPRNLLRGPGLVGLDTALMKNFRVRERAGLQFRAEFFNLPNRPNFGNPSANLNSTSSFGKTSSAGSPRILQFALKLSF
jgi:hypothetical protein